MKNTWEKITHDFLLDDLGVNVTDIMIEGNISNPSEIQCYEIEDCNDLIQVGDGWARIGDDWYIEFPSGTASDIRKGLEIFKAIFEITIEETK